jgi:hypothetical protein
MLGGAASLYAQMGIPAIQQREELMKLKFTWFVPDTLTITDPLKQGPEIAPARDGLSNVITGTNWALKTEALNDDGSPMVVTNDPAVYANSTPIVDVISHFTPFNAPDPENFDDIARMVSEGTMSREQLQAWLEARLFQKLNKADQEQQATDRIMKKVSPTTTFKMPAAPVTEGQE